MAGEKECFLACKCSDTKPSKDTLKRNTGLTEKTVDC